MALHRDQLLQVVKILREQNWTVSFAESCTGGALSAYLTEQAGVSDVFKGSVVSYSNEAKENILGVLSKSLQQEGAVSEIVARQMAQGARRQLKTDWSIAITGIAGPSGGVPGKPVGTVCFAVAGLDFEESRKEIFSGDRKGIQQAAVSYAVSWMLEVLTIGISGEN